MSTAKSLLQLAMANYIEQTRDEHELPVGDLRFVVMHEADKSDPINCHLSVAAKLVTERGVQLGWRVIIKKDPQNWSRTLELALDALFLNMREYPLQNVDKVKPVEL